MVTIMENLGKIWGKFVGKSENGEFGGEGGRVGKAVRGGGWVG